MADHVVEVDYRLTRLGWKYWGFCSCGWVAGIAYADRAYVESIGRGHVIAERAVEAGIAEYRNRKS